MKQIIKPIALALLPPIVVSGLRRLRRVKHVDVIDDAGQRHRKPEWEMVANTDSVWNGTEGWNHASIAERQMEKWVAFIEDLQGSRPLGRSHEAAPDAPTDVSAHNTIMTFGYAVGRVGSEVGKDRQTSILDWGGGIGHYYQYARTLFPDLAIDYVIKDLDVLCRAGRTASSGAQFLSDEAEALGRRYDMVFASSALHYSRDFYSALDRLLKVSDRYFMITRTPFVQKSNDFVVVQRPHRYGYITEYAGWFLNQDKFLSHAREKGFEADREFLLAERPYVPNATEQCEYKGFLLKRRK